MYEYRILESEAPTATKDQLDDLGRQGWELVTVAVLKDKCLYFFKRLAQEVPN